MRFIYTEDSLVTLSSIDISPDCTSLLQQSTAPVLAYSTVPVLYCIGECENDETVIYGARDAGRHEIF